MKIKLLNHIFQEKYSQSGRSMMEMIGVLIIVGIVSLGALFGYSYIIDKYCSNILTDEILQRGLDIKKQQDNFRRWQKVNLDKWEEMSKVGYPIDLIETITDEEFGIQVKRVSQRICQMTFENTISLVPVEINQKKYLEHEENVCTDLENTMVFYFNTDKPDREQSLTCRPSCENPKICVNGKCICGEDAPKRANPDTCECDPFEEYEIFGVCVPKEKYDRCEFYCRKRSN